MGGSAFCLYIEPGRQVFIGGGWNPIPPGPMNLLSWNYRKLGNPYAVNALHSLVRAQGPKILFLVEIKLDTKCFEYIRLRLGFSSCFVVPSLGRNGGLALLWKDDANVTISNFSQHHIDSHVSSANGKWWRFTGFYGHPEAHCRHESWTLLDKLQSLSTLPWLCVGDFNETLSQEEHIGVHARALPRIKKNHKMQQLVNKERLQIDLVAMVRTPFPFLLASTGSHN